MEEQWKKINNIPTLNYSVSNLGRVRNDNTNHILLQHMTSTSKRWYVNIKNKSYNVARLVGFAFLDKPIDKNYINHIDGNKLNNRVDNLEWVTKSENEKHAFANHLKRPTRGELSGMAKLTYQQVEEIRKKYSTGNKKKYSTRKLAKEYNVGKSTVLYIVQGKTWKNEKEVK